MAYEQHTWVVREPITQEKMNHIEGGIEEASSTASSANSLSQAIDTRVGLLSNLDSTRISDRNSIVSAINAVAVTAKNAQSDISTALKNVRLGEAAWSQILPLIELADSESLEVARSLTNRILDDEGAISNAANWATTAINNMLQAYEIRPMRYGSNYNQTAHALSEKIADMHDYLDSIASTVTDHSNIFSPSGGRSITERLAALDANTAPNRTVIAMDSEIVSARGKNKEGFDNDTLDARLDFIDGGGNAPSRTLPNIITEVDGAHRGANDTLDARFDDIDNVGDALHLTHLYRITQLETEMSNARSGAVDLDARLDGIDTTVSQKVAKTDIKKNLTYSTDDDTVLLARQGKLLKDDIDAINDKIGGSYSSSSTVNSAILDLDARLDAIDGGTALTGNDLATRVSSIESEIDAANGSGTLDDRFDAIEGDISILNGNASTSGSVLNTVNSRIAEVVNNAPEAFDTLKEIADWIGENSDDALTMQTNISNNASAITALDTRLDSIDGGSTLTGITLVNRVSTIESDLNTATTGLKARVTALEGKNTTYTEVVHSATYDNNGKPQINNPSENVDYLIKGAGTDTKYYYWKYINNSWELISGAGGEGGGTGNNNAEDYATYSAFESATKEENKDYYVLLSDGVRHHYRYVTIDDTLTQIEIGPLVSQIKKYRLDSGVESDVNYLYLHEFDYGETEYEMTTNNRVSRIPLPSGGGTMSAQKLTRIGTRAITQPLGAESAVLLQFFYTSGIEGESGVGELFLDDISVRDNISIDSGDPANASTSWPSTTPLPTGFYSIDVSNYCTTLGVKHFQLIVRDSDNETLLKDLKWDVNVMNLTLTSTFTEYSINNIGSTVKFTYIANGDIDKVAHFKLGNTVLPTVNLSADTSGEVQEYTIPAQSIAGSYRLEAWLTATANGHDLPPSQSIFRDIIWKDPNSNDVIISCKYNGNQDEPLTQYDILEIPYAITGGTTPYTVSYYVDDMDIPVNEVTLTGNSGLWEYRANEKDGHTLKIACLGAQVIFTINVTELDIDIAPVTLNLALDFNPQGITNTSGKRLWSNDNYHMTVSENFDWYNGGYGSDESGDYFLVKAGTRATFDYKMFTSNEDGGTITNEVFDNGKEFKIIFKTAAVRNADAVWFSNMGPSSSSENAKMVGIQLNAHNGWLKTDSASNTEINGVAATNTYLYFPYSEEDKIELDININQASENDNFIMSYEDGCPSKAYPYKTSEILYHIEGSEADITIGSDDCDVYIYRMRIYDAALTTEKVLRNFIADGKDSAESIDRYIRNSIYYDTKKKEFVPYIGTNTVLDPERLATKIPDIKVLMLETPQFTKSKKDFIPYSSLRCIHAPGGKYFKSRGKEDNWLFQNGYHAGQGTTSDKYGNAGRNLDFLFMCDGIHNPSDKVSVKNENFLPGYRSSLILGYGTTEQQAPMYCLDWKDEDTWKANTAYVLNDLVRQNGQVYKCTGDHTSGSEFDVSYWILQEGYTSKVTLTSTSIPNNFFNLKVNIASSENANNAILQKRYNDFLPYVSPAKLRDARIKNDMEFVPAIIFIKETGQAEVNGETITYERRAFNDSEWHFYALGNIGDSKKTDYTRAYDPQDMNEFTLEISDNNTNNSQFQSGVYMAAFYRPVTNPNAEDLGEYYEAGATTGTVEYNNETQYYGIFTKTLDTELAEKTYYTFIEKRKFLEPYEVVQDKDDNGNLKETFSAKSISGEAVQTTDYIFPIDYATEWAVLDENDRPVNMRYWSLMNEKFDGDHSFEMRYACTGNYRDGKLVNDTHGKITVNGSLVSRDKYQVDTINSNVWKAFYTWLITSTRELFIAELDQWCVRSSVAFFYAFTHYYTMMDNRAKNTFWHFAKTGKYRRVSRPVKELLHVYEEADGEVIEDAQYAGVWNGTFTPTTDINIDSEKTYYTQYAFDMWVYDCDTALGIDNNGELVFPYGKEDKDYRIDGDPSSSYVFNGAGSIFWCRLRDNFNDDIRAMFTSVRAECFNAENLIDEFDKYQECYPEAIWRLDVERKYIRSFTGSTENGVSITNKEIRFLRDMMQGRKKYQRRQWAKDLDTYFGSKYLLPSVFGDFFEFSCYNPSGQPVVPNWNLTITPYLDMYINVSYAETYVSPIRAKAGVRYEIINPMGSTAQNDSRIRVYGANHIQALEGQAIKNNNNEIVDAEGLASFYIKANNFENGKKLRRLILGTDNTSYANGNFTSLNIANDYPILEVLNVKNCGNLGGALDLSKSTALRVIEAQGTLISQVLLPGSTGITTLHLPDTITKLELDSAKQLENLTINNRAGEANLSNLTQLDIDDSDYSENINWMTLAKTVLNHLDLLSLTKLRISSIGDIDELESFRERKQTVNRVYLDGIVLVTGEWSAVERDYYGKPNGIWPTLEFNTNNGTEVVRYKVIYKYDAYTNDGAEIYSTYITPTLGSDSITIPEIYSNRPGQTSILSLPPTKASTKEQYYAFGLYNNSNIYTQYSGWHLAGSDTPLNVSSPNILLNTIQNNTIVVEAIFYGKPMSYPIYWYLNTDDEEPVYIAKDNDNNIVTVEYGKSYTGHVPTVQDLTGKTLKTLEGTDPLTYKIFNGWQTSPINLTLTDEEAAEEQPAYKIYAKWYTGTKSLAAIRDSEGYSPEKLLLFSLSLTVRTNAQYFSTNKRFDIPMGYNGSDDGTQITPFTYNNEEYVNTFSGDGLDIYSTTIRPLTEANNAFTLVLDYLFDTNHIYANNIVEAVLAGCYENIGNATYGFRLFFDNRAETDGGQCIRVGFGETTSNITGLTKVVADGKAGLYRNIIVLRHIHNDPVLYIYSGIRVSTGNGLNANSNLQVLDNLDADGFVQTIEWSNISTNAKLVFGALAESAVSNTTITNAKGTIFWSKYWNYDVGDNECRLLAAWPHETITFGVLDYNGMTGDRVTPTIPGVTQPNIVLTALSTSSYIGPILKSIYNENHTNGDLSGWNNSWYRTFSNNRIFFGLPIPLQSIITKTTNVCRLKIWDGSKYTSSGYSGTVNTQDYIFFPGYTETYTGTNTIGQPYSSEGTRPYYWCIDSAVTNYVYLDNAFSSTGNNTETRKYMNIRFPYIALLPNGNRIFTNYPSSGASVYSKIPNIRRGDMFMIAGQSVPFIYVTSDDISKYGVHTIPNTGIFECEYGGWIRGEQWWLRSIGDDDVSQTTWNVFMYIQPQGESTHYRIRTTLSNYNTQPSTTLSDSAIGCCICYSFGV